MEGSGVRLLIKAANPGRRAELIFPIGQNTEVCDEEAWGHPVLTIHRRHSAYHGESKPESLDQTRGIKAEFSKLTWVTCDAAKVNTSQRTLSFGK